MPDVEWSQPENDASVVGTLRANDPDNEGDPDWKRAQTHTYAFVGDAVGFQIDGQTGDISSQLLDFEVIAQHELRVSATDALDEALLAISGADVVVAPTCAPLSCGGTCADGRSTQRVWLPQSKADSSVWIAFARRRLVSACLSKIDI